MNEVEEIAKLVREKYGRCGSYVDSGITTSTSENTKRVLRFDTYFLRPQYLRLEWQRFEDDKPIGAKRGIWSDGEHTRIKTSKIETRPECMEMGVAIASGASQAFHIVASLLSSRIRLISVIDNLADPELVGDEQVRSQECYVLSERNQRFWISKVDYTIWKIEIDHASEDLDVALAARERALALSLNRTPNIPPHKTHIVQFEYQRVAFNNPIQKDVFDFPWKTEE